MQQTGFPNLATPAGSTAYYVIRFSNPKWHDDLACIFLWKHELSKLYSISDPGVARMKLQWWMEQINLPPETPSNHELAAKLSSLCHRHQSIPNAFRSIALVIDKHLHRMPCQSIDDFWQDCMKLGGGFSALINAVSDNQTLENEEMIGAFIIAVEWIQLMGQHVRNSLQLIPAPLLEQHRISFEQLLYTDKHEQARATLEKLFEQLQRQAVMPDAHRSNLPLYKYYRLRKKLLDLLISERFDVLHQKISLTPIRKLWFAL